MSAVAARANPGVGLREAGMMMVSGEVHDDLAKELVTWILEENLRLDDRPKRLCPLVNSSGGSVTAGFAILDAMQGSKIPVHTVALGQVASMGLLIFMAGTKGHRKVTPNTSILSHQWSWGSMGKEHELVATAREFELTSERMMAHYRRCTGLKEKVIREKLLPAHDIYLSAAEAMALGIADEVVALG